MMGPVYTFRGQDEKWRRMLPKTPQYEKCDVRRQYEIATIDETWTHYSP